MRSRFPRPLSLALAALLLLPAIGVVASAMPEAPVAFLVGFHELPPSAFAGEYAGEAVTRVDETLRFAVVHARDPAAFEARVAHDPNVRYARVDDADAYRAAWTPSDPRAPEQYAWARVNASRAWDTTRGSSAVIVAIVDSGIERTHEDLTGPVLQGRDFVGGDTDPQDDCGHGTHVAGTVGATLDNAKGGTGAAQVTLLPVKVLSNYCRGSWSQVASGIRYAADQGADVISLSLSCGITCYDQAAADALEYAWSKGALLVVAAGNEGPCDACIGFPASHPRALPVGCTDLNDAMCTFSSRGSGMVVAPGKDILSTTVGNTYGLNSGTSMSTPHVSGGAALALSRNPTLTNAQLRSLIETTARDLGTAGQDGTFGRGILDMGALVAAAGSAPAPAPDTRAVSLAATSSEATIAKGGTATFLLTLTNAGTTSDTYTIAKNGAASGWKTTLSASSVTLAPGATAQLKLTVKAPRNAPAGSGLDVTVSGVSTADPLVRATALLRTMVT